MAGEIDEVARAREHALAPAHHLGADLGEHDLAGPALDQRHPEQLLEIADLHGKSGLGHRAGLRGAAEMPVLGERIEISQLAQGDHER